MTDDLWTVRETAGGYALFYDGAPWPMMPRASRADAQAYLERVRERYQEGTIRSVCEDRSDSDPSAQ